VLQRSCSCLTLLCGEHMPSTRAATTAADDDAASAVTVRWSKYLDRARDVRQGEADVEKVSATKPRRSAGGDDERQIREPATTSCIITANDYSGDGGGGVRLRWSTPSSRSAFKQ